ncbi:telomere length regulation protein-domain-containing protein [Clohesyomyces aquaticus]|uniref:Telomere length regulation protein-domain-containing protein n=1 Tax=Clohesyomyces aquaticus TaxID=1231657 RepID=A0A1Y1ZF95_9PLEO|nr:telomere length regulation protein-domain-containing protein [Clohesyomyces aquaticus]
MDDFLTPVFTTTVRLSKEPAPGIDQSAQHDGTMAVTTKYDSPEEAYKFLKDQPDFDTTGKLLRYFLGEFPNKHGFSLATPGPLQAQVVDVLVTITVPDYWRTFKRANRNVLELVRCLRNPSGLGAIISRLRPLIDDCRKKKPVDQTRDPSAHIEDLLDVLENILDNDNISSQLSNDIRSHAQNPIQSKLMWKEFVVQTTSGRILSVAAEAEDILKQRGISRQESWLANGNAYASWLGRTLAILMRDKIGEAESVVAVTEMSGKALTLGYNDRIVASIVVFLVESGPTKALDNFLPKMKAHEQRQYLNATISFLAKQYFTSTIDDREGRPLQPSTAISGAAALLHKLIESNELLQDHVVSLLTNSALPALDDSLAARRVVLAAIATIDDKIQNVLEKSIRLFGDKFYIKHTPVLQQEALAQTLVISCGYIQRSAPMFLTMMAKSSYHVNGVSNRIGASSPRARFLGMVVGSAISRMVDKPDLQLKFDLDGANATEAKWYERLTQVNDRIGSIKDLQAPGTVGGVNNKTPSKKRPLNTQEKPQALSKSAITEISGPRIVEILSGSEDEEDDLVPYAKPDSDPEDDTDDPTMIERNKPTAPVYIRDLIAGLRDQDNYDRHQLAFSTAASLIRRKANFGTEVTDHIEELASVLTGMNDTFDLPDFDEQRQQALIAVLLAKPGPMAQWFARSFFSGDFSLSQRIAMLTTIGLGARALAGLKDSSSDDLIPATPSFPSKTLPPHLHKIYAPTTSDPVAAITKGLARQLLSPLAASAADQLSGPNILKVRTFSSRMEVEKRRQKPIPNALAQIVADNFFFPLTGRWWMNTHSSTQLGSTLGSESGSGSGSGSYSQYTSPHLLPPYLHTLAILLHAAGPNTLALPQMTREFWELLLSVRGLAVADKSILGALLFAFLMVLETNEDKERLANEQAKELLETREWVRGVFEGLGGGEEGGEDEKVRVLAAGVILRCQEVVEKYQRRMAGNMLDY